LKIWSFEQLSAGRGKTTNKNGGGKSKKTCDEEEAGGKTRQEKVEHGSRATREGTEPGSPQGIRSMQDGNALIENNTRRPCSTWE